MFVFKHLQKHVLCLKETSSAPQPSHIRHVVEFSQQVQVQTISKKHISRINSSKLPQCCEKHKTLAAVFYIYIHQHSKSNNLKLCISLQKRKIVDKCHAGFQTTHHQTATISHSCYCYADEQVCIVYRETLRWNVAIYRFKGGQKKRNQLCDISTFTP